VIVEIAQRLQAGEQRQGSARHARRGLRCSAPASCRTRRRQRRPVELPAFEAGTRRQASAFADATRLLSRLETSPHNGRTLVQFHDRQAVVMQSAGTAGSTTAGMDAYLRPALHAPRPPACTPTRIPAHEVVKDSVTIMRGCFGGCTFCSITMHQGRIIQSRSKDSIIAR
jgi:radical SAM superfamily enzyme YgiQ (UPF0313 family)